MSTKFAFTQILVNDAEAMKAFFSNVFRMRELSRLEVDLGQPVLEIMLGGVDEPGHVLVLVQLLDGTPTVQGESMLGYITDEFDAVLERAVANGGVVVKEPVHLPGSGERVAIFNDPEGHACEIMTPPGQSS